jgi:[ribosomal protein S5]-alanine N-acetyltransferase
MNQPVLHTARLTLRPFVLADGPDVQRLAGAREIADTTLLIPHPYPDGAAEQWIATHPERFAAGKVVTYAITLTASGELCGATGLGINREHQHAELGYWIGVPYWNQGYTTEAAAALLNYGFSELNLHRIFSLHFARNPASGRVMQKIGMRYEGTLLQHWLVRQRYEDLVHYGLLRSDWERT